MITIQMDGHLTASPDIKGIHFTAVIITIGPSNFPVSIDSVFIRAGRKLLLFRSFVQEEASGVEWTGDLTSIRIRESAVPGQVLRSHHVLAPWIGHAEVRRSRPSPPETDLFLYLPPCDSHQNPQRQKYLAHSRYDPRSREQASSSRDLGDDSMSFPRLLRLMTGHENMPICASSTTWNNPFESGAQRRKNRAIIPSPSLLV